MILSMSLVQDSFNSSQQGDLVVLSGNMCVIFIGHLFQLGNHALNVPLDRKSIEAKLHSGPLQSLRLWIPGFWPYCGWLFHRVTMRCDVFLFMIIYIYIYLCYIYISNYVLYKWNSYCIHYVNLCSTCGCIYFTVYIYIIYFFFIDLFVCVIEAADFQRVTSTQQFPLRWVSARMGIRKFSFEILSPKLSEISPWYTHK